MKAGAILEPHHQGKCDYCLKPLSVGHDPHTKYHPACRLVVLQRQHLGHTAADDLAFAATPAAQRLREELILYAAQELGARMRGKRGSAWADFCLGLPVFMAHNEGAHLGTGAIRGQ